MASEIKNQRRKRRERTLLHIIIWSGVLAGITAFGCYASAKPRLAAAAAANHDPHGAAGLALDGFAGFWVIFVVASVVIWAIVSLSRPKRSEPDRPMRRGRRNRAYTTGR